MTTSPASAAALRSRTMRAVRSKDTAPEMRVRRLAHRLGYRYRLHRKDLPGKPDLAFPSRRKVIFVHGCWWHRHDCPHGRRLPATRREYWLPKLSGNRRRDRENRRRLEASGWEVLTVWECEVTDDSALRERLRNFLGETLSPPGDPALPLTAETRDSFRPAPGR